ncbi:MetQ/NlpA family ABC transporter substrate-binding protein [Carnobacterium inhibens]|uniref:Lipoprotein n=2 Tax=Carnobacterium inhibens TaxID=147709 RepID=U5SB68_9LACT|nr:MetQ/NlpA family ABC transporter substrate-binding protein [Carnobacterium inhibens]AGY81072.1 methionine ABC transporter substrate-binding protein [Carnobacterium inhibens subsp. gilichinskyi]MBC9825692.1 methionine ABC transporter substrate-binding protein [Carnobacterium inhibens]
MKKKTILSALATAGVIVTLAACGNGNEESNGSNAEDTTIKIGASNVPHAEILEFVQPILEEEGITLDITTYNDYVIPNVALDEGEIDANYFQHIPFFDAAVEENGYDFVNAGSIHIEPLAIFSQRYESLDDVEDGATVLVSNNQADWGRVIGIFQEAGLVTVKDGVDLTTATFEDIDENPKNLVFEYENDPALMTTLYQQDEAELIAINSNFAVDQDISPIDDSVAIESTSSPYANIIAVRSEDAEDPAILKLVETLKSKEVQDFILEEWDGAVVPVTE